MLRFFHLASRSCALCCALFFVRASVAAERVQLRNGFSVDCSRRELAGDGRVRLLLDATGSYMDVDANAVVGVEPVESIETGAGFTKGSSNTGVLTSPIAATQGIPTQGKPTPGDAAHGRASHDRTSHGRNSPGTASPEEATHEVRPVRQGQDALEVGAIQQFRAVRPGQGQPLGSIIASAGMVHNVNIALLESVVNAESAGHVRAVSRTGARGLMQLMPATARSLGVEDSFAPEENLRGGATYLDRLLTRYHDDLALALAAYNAGPGAVDRYHGVPPYRETVAYVSRIIREFNRRTLLERQVERQARRSAALLAETVPAP